MIVIWWLGETPVCVLCGRPGDTPARFAPKPIDLKPKDKLINIRFNLSWYTHALKNLLKLVRVVVGRSRRRLSRARAIS